MKVSCKYVYQSMYRMRNFFLTAKCANKNKAELPPKWFYSHYKPYSGKLECSSILGMFVWN